MESVDVRLQPRSPLTVQQRASVAASLLNNYDVPSRVCGEVERDYVNKPQLLDRDVADADDQYVDTDTPVTPVGNRRRNGTKSSSSSQDLERSVCRRGCVEIRGTLRTFESWRVYLYIAMIY
jgi:hypothetical protein